LDDTPPYARKKIKRKEKKNKIKSPVGVMRMEEFRELISGVGERGPNQNPKHFSRHLTKSLKNKKNYLKKKGKMGLV
jgi:hypothetical protein